MDLGLVRYCSNSRVNNTLFTLGLQKNCPLSYNITCYTGRARRRYHQYTVIRSYPSVIRYYFAVSDSYPWTLLELPPFYSIVVSLGVATRFTLSWSPLEFPPVLIINTLFVLAHSSHLSLFYSVSFSRAVPFLGHTFLRYYPFRSEFALLLCLLCCHIFPIEAFFVICSISSLYLRRVFRRPALAGGPEIIPA